MEKNLSLSASKSFLRKLKNKLKTKVKQKLKSIFFRTFRQSTCLKTQHLGNSFIKCNWSLSEKDKIVLSNPRIYCLGIRIYDITLADLKYQTSCVMKEIQINKHSCESFFEAPILDGILRIEIGYRSLDGEWIAISNSTLNLGNRSIPDSFYDDSWFYLSPQSTKIPNSLHERIYKESRALNSTGSEQFHKSIANNLGGSEKIYR